MRKAGRVALALLALAFGGGAGVFAALSSDQLTAPIGQPAVEVDASTGATPTPWVTTDARPVTIGPQLVRIGPDEEYAMLGTLTGGQKLDVVGRDAAGEWIAIVFGGANLTGWLPVEAVAGIETVEGLQVVAPKLLPLPTQPPAVAANPPSGGGPRNPPAQPPAARNAPTPRPARPQPTATPPPRGEEDPRQRQPQAAPTAPLRQQQQPDICQQGYRNARERDYYMRNCR